MKSKSSVFQIYDTEGLVFVYTLCDSAVWPLFIYLFRICVYLSYLLTLITSIIYTHMARRVHTLFYFYHTLCVNSVCICLNEGTHIVYKYRNTHTPHKYS